MLWYCGECTTVYAVGLEKCPQCGRPSAELATAPPGIQEPAQRPAEPRRRRKADEPEPDADA